MLRKVNWDKTLQKSLKFSYCRKSIRKQIRPSCRKNLSTSFYVCLVSWKQRNLEIRANIPKSCRRPVVSLLYATKSTLALAFTAPNFCWACALASLVTFLTGDHVMQTGFGQISPSASSARDLGTRLVRTASLGVRSVLFAVLNFTSWGNLNWALIRNRLLYRDRVLFHTLFPRDFCHMSPSPCPFTPATQAIFVRVFRQ